MADATNEAGNDTTTTDPQVETRARSMGWRPKTEWVGDQSKWVDATEFVQRGDQVIPIIKSENRRLHETVEQQNARIAQQDAEMKELKTSIESLKNFNTEMSEERVKAMRAKIAKEIKEARDNGDVERELELNDQLGAATDALNESKAKAKETPKTTTTTQSTPPPLDPEWLAQNSWFGPDEARTDLSIGIGQRLRAKFPNLVGRPFLNKLSEEVLKAMPIVNTEREAPSRVEGGSNGAGGGGAGNQSARQKTYADLPADAKAVCDRYEKQLVGSKAFPTKEAFQKHFVSQYDFS